MSVWEIVTLAPEQCRYWHIGKTKVWVRRVQDEWQVGTTEEEPPKPDRPDTEAEETTGEEQSDQAGAPSPVWGVAEEVPEELEWRVWVMGDASDRVRLVPQLSSLPVVVRPETPIRIPPQHKAMFFIGIPIWLRVEVGEGKKVLTIFEKELGELSKTWFGDTMSGELCYSWKSRAWRKVEDIQFEPTLAVCPLRVKNAAEVELNFRKVCVRVQHLQIYEGEKHLWSNEVKITFAGTEQHSTVDIEARAPAFETAAQLRGEAREVLSLGRRSLGQLRSFTG